MKLKNTFVLFARSMALALAIVPAYSQGQVIFNRAPLKADTYIQLPLGSIKAKGWLLKQLELQKNGATGHAEELYPGKDELGPGSDWIGGNGNSWEKLPYYIKGLTALAYTLNDAGLKAKAQKWIDYTLNHQQENGLFGPEKMKDWWPRMPYLYALQNYYEATNDKRVIPFLGKYFKYELANLDHDPLRDWGKARAGDNIEIVLWLYNKTGDRYLIDLAKKLKEQAYNWADIFNNNEFFYFDDDFYTRHMVNVAEALKMPVVYSQLDTTAYYANAMQNGIDYIMRDHGLPQGLGSGTETLAGDDAAEGVETCAVVEWMQSLETAFRIQHNAAIGDQLEKVAFNALPAQFTKDLKNHTYYTLPNQVQALPGPHGFNQDYANGIVPSPYSGYPCCRYNMHMGWPYFVKNSWSATPDGGLAASIYAPMEVNTVVAKNIPVTINEDTEYPFEEQVRLKLTLQTTASFSLHLRIPGWCTKASVAVNGNEVQGVTAGEMLVINRAWHNNDVITLNLPMEIAVKQQVNNAVSIERGPLVYALKIEETEKNTKAFPVKGCYETEISPASAWNYGLVLGDDRSAKNITVIKDKMPENPFVQKSTPVTLKVKAKRIPAWKIDYNNTAALDIPFSPTASNEKTEDITLVPFGAEDLRVSIFPTIGTPQVINTSYTQNFDHNTSTGMVFYGSAWFCKDNAIHTVVNENGKPGPGTKLIATGTRFTNFEYTANVSLNSAGDAGVIFRVSDAAIGADAYKGYYVGLNAQSGVVQFGKADGKKWTVIASSKIELVLNKPYKVTVKATGDRFEIYVGNNNKVIITATDDEFSTGSVGLRAYNALASVDNIEVVAK